jgi:hypothetical protein
MLRVCSQYLALAGCCLLVGCMDREPSVAIELEKLERGPGEVFPANLSSVNFSCWFIGNSYSRRDFPVLDRWAREWYSEAVASVGDGALPATRGDGLAVRFIYLKGTYPNALVTITGTPRDRLNLTASKIDDSIAPDQVDRVERTLSAAEANELARFLVKSELLAVPAKVCDDLNGADGSQWITEISAGGDYHYVDRWSPQDGVSHDFGVFMLGLTRWQFEDLE